MAGGVVGDVGEGCGSVASEVVGGAVGACAPGEAAMSHGVVDI